MMPASEFIKWQAFFSIYPFSQDRQDQRIASMISAITYTISSAAQGKYLRKPLEIDSLIPDYLGLRDLSNITLPTLAEQKERFSAFMSKLKSVQKEAKGL